MSTTLLNRRMDLIHTSTNAINTLKMDTSYPVRLSGIVIKVFQAIANYSNIDPKTGSEFSDATNLFFVQNQEGASVTTIQKQNVFDFAGKKLKNDEYITGDYVLAIIDINNNKIFIHSLQNATGIGRDDPIYTKDMDYHCNGINDNTVLGGISNILIDLYDYSQNINYDQDEFTYSITNANRQDIFPYDRFTINIIGKFGIDYSATDFVYPSYSNRQNRSIIMKIAGTLYKGDNIDIGSEKDLEMVFDWTRCYIPKINYNNETFAAMYNTKLDHLDENGNPIYYDYWTHENTAHFTNSTTGEAYGNLFPRRLIFASIEGALPINVTFKNFVINTFCTAIYSQTESKKTIKLQNSKITINGSYSDVNIPNGDITNNESFYRSMPAPYGCGLDINAWNPTVIIDNCEIKNANDCKDSNLIINSCSNMIVTNSIISDFNNSSDGYKIGYTRGYLDFERFLDYEYSTEYILNESIDPSYDLSNPNTIESIIALYSFYKKGNIINVINNSKDIAMVNPSYTMNMNVSISGRHDIVDFSSTPYEIDYNNRTISYYKYTAKSKSGIDNCRTFGALKNIPVLYYDNPADSKCLGLRKTDNPISPINTGVGSDDVYIRCNNRESLYMPKLSISDSSIMCAGILFQYNAKTNFNNCVLSSKMFDYRYYPHPIHLLSGELTINNCECSFDTRNSKYFIGYGTVNNERISYIKVYNNLIAEPSNNANTFDMDTPSIVPLSSTKLNIIGSRITLIPDILYNTISNNCTKYSSNTLVFRNNRKDGCIKQTYNSMSLSYINSSIYTIDKDNPSFFNPSIAPNINIESSEFLINDTYSTSENYKMGGPDELPYLGDVHKLSALSIVVRVGTIFDTILEDNSKYTTSVSSLPTSDNIYKNYINAVRIQKYNHNGTSVKYIDRIFDISTGIVTTYVTDINDNVTKEESTQFDLSACTTNKSKLKKMEMFNGENLFYLYEKAAYLNGDTNCTLDSNRNNKYITNANGTVIHKNNIENHIIICYIYGADLPQTGYYIYKSIRDLLNDNTVDSLNDIESIYNNFGVTAFELENTVFNMSNSNIGSGMNYVGARNTYGMETFVRRSPRICFNFKSAGIYKISNTNANAWGTVLWSTLNKNARKAYDNYKTGDYRIPAPFDYSTLTQHNYGSLVIDNCNFKNYSALRFKETSEDWMDYLDSNYNIRLDANLYKKEIYDKNNFGYSLTNGTDKNELRLQKSVLNQTRQKYSRTVDEVPQYDYYVEDFNETIRNANEMPVMYINNTNLINTLINNSNLNGNESIIVQGNVKFNGCTYINLGNGILCYIGYSLYESNHHPEWYSVPKLTVKDCNLIAIKDVMYDSYIDHDLRRISNDDISTYGSINGNMYTFEEQCMNKGMIKYDNVITSFFIESDKVQTEFTGNTFISKCNSYNSIYSLHNTVRTRLIYFNSGDSQTDNTLIFKDNNVSMIYGCPGFYNSGYTYLLRFLPSSINYAVIDFNNNTYGNNKKSVLISNNKFDIKTLINNKNMIAIKLGSIDPSTSILNSIPSFYTPEQYIIYKEECIVEDKRNSNGDILEIKYKGIYNINKTIIEDNRDRCYDSTIFTKNISDTKLINPFDVSLEAGSPNTGVSNTFEDYIIDDDVMYKCIPIDNISDFSNKEYHDSISNQDGTTSYYYNTSRYVISNSKIKKSSSANDYNFMYAKFNTPILKSNNFINANIYGNIICNSDPSLSNEDIYTLSSDETISTLHSSCIIDVYEDNNVSLLEPYKININNNIFTDSNPKGILISTENIKREDDGTIWKMYSMGENGYILNQFLCIQEILNNVVHRYFKYSNFSELYKKTMYKNGYPVDGESYKKYIDTKSYSIKVNDTTEDNLRDNVFFNDVSHSIQLSSSNNTYNTLYAYADRFSNNNGNLLFYSGKIPSNINTDTKHYNYIHYINLETLDNYLMDILTNNNRLNIDNELSFIGETLIFYIESSEFNYCMCKCNILPCYVFYSETDGASIIKQDLKPYYFNTVDYSQVSIKTTSTINIYKYNIENERYETNTLGPNSVLNINLSKIVCIYGSSPTASHPNYMISLDTTDGVYYITLESLKNYYDNGAIITNNHQEIYSTLSIDGLPIDITSKMFTYSQTKINKGDKFYYKYELTDTNYHGESDTIIIPYKNKYDLIKLENCALLKTRIPNYNFVLPGTTKESLETMFEIFNDINCITLEMKYNSNTYRCDIYFNELPDLYFTYADNEVILSDDELVNNKPYLNNVMYNSYLVNPIQIGIINNGNNLLSLGDKISVLDETSYYSDMIAENTGVRLNTSNNNYKVNSGYYNQNNKDTNSKESTLNKLRTDLNNEYSDIT